MSDSGDTPSSIRAQVHEWRSSSRGTWHAFCGSRSTHSQCTFLERDPAEVRARRLTGRRIEGSRKTPPPAGSKICQLCATDVGYQQRGHYRTLSGLDGTLAAFQAAAQRLAAEVAALGAHAPELIAAAHEAAEELGCRFEDAGGDACLRSSPSPSCAACRARWRLSDAILAYTAETLVTDPDAIERLISRIAQSEVHVPGRSEPLASIRDLTDDELRALSGLHSGLCGHRYPGSDWPGRVLCERTAGGHRIHVNDSYGVSWESEGEEP